MKIIALSDIHGRLENLKQLLSKAGKADLVLAMGDWTNYGPKETAIREIREIKQKTSAKIFGICGNLDSKDVLQALEEEKISIHSKKEKFKETTFVGFGGGIENNIGETLFSEKEIFETIEKLAVGEKDFILVTHLPPKNSKLDFSSSKEHIGSESVRKIIEKFGPKIHLCGHCHEGFGIEKIKNTLCINVAAVKEGRLAVIELNEKTNAKIEFIKI